MALSRIGSFKDIPVIASRLNHPVNGPKADIQCLQGKLVDLKRPEVYKTAGIHVSGARRYPEAPRLSLPGNVSQIFGNETGRFTPERSRDISTPVLLYGINNSNSQSQRATFNAPSEGWGSSKCSSADSHVDSYDCFGAVNLNSSMQSTVPKPFCSAGKSTHLNMPGSDWSGSGKYIAEFMRKSHYAVLKSQGPFSARFKSVD